MANDKHDPRLTQPEEGKLGRLEAEQGTEVPAGVIIIDPSNWPPSWGSLLDESVVLLFPEGTDTDLEDHRDIYELEKTVETKEVRIADLIRWHLERPHCTKCLKPLRGKLEMYYRLAKERGIDSISCPDCSGMEAA